ncbi:MAG: hypothetical protein JSW34_09905 [Candidatus Zixiibacteriota bacterium]|nr:MAG: hypothetical protein JSW34_09905 [candidate division Zixibacteria bacterium]
MMRKILGTTTMVVLTALSILLIGLGCSGDNPVSQADGVCSGTDTPSVIMDKSSTNLEEPTFVETFDKHSNVGGWSFFGNPDNRIEVYEPHDGNPGAFIHATCDGWSCLDTYAPQLRTQVGVSSIFTGDYRARKVAMVGVDLVTFGPELVTTEGRPLSLLLRNDNGTPTDWTDDVVAYWIGNKNIPHESGQFKEFVIEIPSQSTTLPKGWGIMSGYSTGDDDADWNKAITDVSQITFFYGNPEMFFMFQQWELGFDNVAIWLDE